jgi:hypothetical protein
MAEWTTRGTVDKIGPPSAIKDDIDDENQFTIPSYFRAREWAPSKIDLSVSGTFTATVSLQRSFDDGTTWHTVEEYTAPTEKIIENPTQSVKWRLGVLTGDFTVSSTDISVRLSQT